MDPCFSLLVLGSTIATLPSRHRRRGFRWSEAVFFGEQPFGQELDGIVQLFFAVFGGSFSLCILWIYRPPNNSDHKDYYIFYRESLQIFVAVTVTGWGVDSTYTE